jgi:hypothetical protein
MLYDAQLSGRHQYKDVGRTSICPSSLFDFASLLVRWKSICTSHMNELTAGLSTQSSALACQWVGVENHSISSLASQSTKSTHRTLTDILALVNLLRQIQLLWILAQHSPDIDISTDSTLLAGGSYDGRARIRSLDTGELVAGPKFKISDGSNTTFRPLEDSRKLADLSDFGRCLQVWDVCKQGASEKTSNVELPSYF